MRSIIGKALLWLGWRVLPRGVRVAIAVLIAPGYEWATNNPEEFRRVTNAANDHTR